MGIVHDVVAAHLPGYPVHTVTQIGEGLDNLAYEVNGELIVRFSKEPDPARLGKEARLLAAVARISPLPVPGPVFTAAESGCLAYFKLAGVPLLEMADRLRPEQVESIACSLGGLLRALHAEPVGRWTDLVDTDDQPLSEWRLEAAQTYAAVAERVPAAHRPQVEAFLDAPMPQAGDSPVFSHNDLGIEHVLIDPAAATVTGIIDWSDAAIVDPARDFGLLYRDLGEPALRAAVARYRAGDSAGLWERAVFYGRCTVFEDLAYGIEADLDRYVTKCLKAMEWLFPA